MAKRFRKYVAGKDWRRYRAPARRQRHPPRKPGTSGTAGAIGRDCAVAVSCGARLVLCVNPFRHAVRL